MVQLKTKHKRKFNMSKNSNVFLITVVDFEIHH